MTHESDSENLDSRQFKSRHAIRDAFVELVLTQRYEEIKVSEIIQRSGVARSTFYEHFANKEAILANSLIPPMSHLASAVNPNASIEPIEKILLHFWENRSFCRIILGGTPGKAMMECLSKLLEENIKVQLQTNRQQLMIENHHAAQQIAAAQLSLLANWIKGFAKCSAENLAMAMAQTSCAILQSLTVEQD